MEDPEVTDEFDPRTAAPAEDDAADADSKAVEQWASTASPGVKPAARRAAVKGMTLAFRGNDIHGLLRHSIKIMPGAVRKGVEREWNRAVAKAGKKQSLEDYWAENGTRMLNERFVGRGSWRAQAKAWLRSAIDNAHKTIGLRADSSVAQEINKALQ